MRRSALHVVAICAGVAIALPSALVLDGRSTATPPTDMALRPTMPRPAPKPDVDPQGGAVTILAWAPGGLPEDIENDIRALPGVMDTTLVATHLRWLIRSVDASGATLDDPAGDLSIPMEVAFVDPVGYSKFVAPSERQTVLSLRRGETLLARSSAQLRNADRGADLRFGAHVLEVAGELSDISAGGYEAVMRRRAGTDLSRSFLLVRAKDADVSAAIDRALRKRIPAGRAVRTRIKGETPFLRYGDAVPPQMVLKETFGEFAARPTTDGRIEIDPDWIAREIDTYRVPLMGRVTCHRSLVQPLRSAMNKLADQGLRSAVDPGSGDGCFVARFLNWDRSNFLSHHSWGAALDINVARNPYGSAGAQDARLIEALEENGFTWGGRFLIPDPMHFEWVRFP
jgi:hypothetical protein